MTETNKYLENVYKTNCSNKWNKLSHLICAPYMNRPSHTAGERSCQRERKTKYTTGRVNSAPLSRSEMHQEVLTNSQSRCSWGQSQTTKSHILPRWRREERAVPHFLSVTLLSVHPSAADLALDVTAPMVLALAPLHLLDADGGVAPTAAHVITAVVPLGTRVAWPGQQSSHKFSLNPKLLSERISQQSHSHSRQEWPTEPSCFDKKPCWKGTEALGRRKNMVIGPTKSRTKH
jgi:hypothetical protein